MNALLCVDHRFVQGPGGEIYSPGQFPYALWERYLEMFDRLTVVGRCRQLAASERAEVFNLSSGPRVSFVFLPNLASIAGIGRRERARESLEGTVAEADVVIARLPSENGLIAAQLGRRMSKPVVAEVTACPWDQLWNYGTVQAKLYAPVQTWRTRRAIARHASSAIYVSEFLRRRYPPRPGALSAVISDVVLPPTPDTVLERRLERIRTLQERRLVLGTIGSLQHEYKGLRTLLETLAEAWPWLPDFELRVLGPGDPQPWREVAAKAGRRRRMAENEVLAGRPLEERVTFCGTLPAGAAVFAWLDEIDLYLQPSFQEGMPRALIEAMSRGCPAIGSTAGGIPELLGEQWLHRPGDTDRLAELITRTSSNRDWLEAMARANFQKAKEFEGPALDDKRADFWNAAVPWSAPASPRVAA